MNVRYVLINTTIAILETRYKFPKQRYKLNKRENNTNVYLRQ